MPDPVWWALVVIACVMPYGVAALAEGAQKSYDHAVPFGVTLTLGLLWLVALGGFVAMGVYGGNHFNSSFEGYWIVGGFMTYFSVGTLLSAIRNEGQPTQSSEQSS